jgi:CheY-like chemotaxis protein
VSFEVSDTGMGIEPEALSEIFEAFTQTKAGAAAGGTGLGLAISRRLLDRMGAELQVESAPGAGSRFSFALPLVPAGEAPARDGEAGEPSLDARLAPGQQVTALVVDDSTVSRRILGSLLESAGLQVITATGGVEGVAVATSLRPDVIFMDVKMADLDGFTATRRLAADERTARIPVIAVTASALGNSRQAAKEAGCVAHLPKPVRAQAVFAALQTHLGLVFVSDGLPPVLDEAHGGSVMHDPKLAARLRAAVAIGDVTELEAIAAVLVRGTEAEAAVGQRLARLAANFDFEGVRDLSLSLEGTGATDHVS